MLSLLCSGDATLRSVSLGLHTNGMGQLKESNSNLLCAATSLKHSLQVLE